ncbi:MAG: type IV pili methyl-accepting chemotaxis transducer N-terminal domain-containing protein [Thiobacillus sp.]|nr:type IV pili methyl-accepting chemotaxis transducer N-terminal domain-containing protein [Thiobacillus sp.]
MSLSLAKWIPGKYRQIVYAVAAFLLFDLGVLVLNFYTSYQISEDAVSINLAGRQRMLSQRMTKSLLAMQSDALAGEPQDAALEELRTTVALFDTSFRGFESGGEVKGGDGTPVPLVAVASPAGRAILAKARAVWDPYLAALQPVLRGDASWETRLPAAVAYGRANNVKLLGLMNDLTSHLEREASAKASRLRLIQTAGIALALLNFAFILVHFLRQLRESDQVIEAAQQETQEILATVKEGLFLLGPDLRIGTQVSASLPGILGERARPGTDFFEVLDERVPATALQAARDYARLLFGDRVKESLMGDLNPLSLMEMTQTNDRGEPQTHFLSIHFNQVRVGGRVSHLLVTVQDVSEQVRLERALAAADARTRSETEALLKVLTTDSASLLGFLDQARQTLLRINTTLKNHNSDERYDGLINGIFRQIHTLKGDAAMLGLDLFEAQAHEFERLLIALREQPDLRGNDLVAIPLKLDAFLDRLATVRDIAERLTSSRVQHTPAVLAGKRFAQLGKRIAADHGKAVELAVELDKLNALDPCAQTTVSEIAVQLLRNAVVHGIETPQQRTQLNKPAQGNVHIRLHAHDNGEFELCVRDDGSGLSPARIRETLLASGRYTVEQLDQWDHKQLIMRIFEPGFSTVTTGDRDAGHGVGLDVVKQKIARLGARLSIATRPERFTEFSIRFTVPA